jgi:hypothetical protein
VSFGNLTDFSHPDFEARVRKVTSKDCRSFFESVVGHLRDKAPREVLKTVLQKCAELVDDPKCASMFCNVGVVRLLPHKDHFLSGVILDVLEGLVAHVPVLFDSGFVSVLSDLLHRKPRRVVHLLSVYSKSFDEIENPWPILDIVVNHAKLLAQSPASADAVALIRTLLKNESYYERRLHNCRSALPVFLTSDDTATVLATYRLIGHIVDGHCELDFSLIQDHLLDKELCPSAIALLLKIPDLAPSTDLVFGILRASRHLAKASELLLNLVQRVETAKILMRQPKFLKHPLPTFADTFQILLQILTFQNLRDQVAECEELPMLFAAAADEKSVDAWVCFDRVLRRISVNRNFLGMLDDNDFLRNLAAASSEVDDPDALVGVFKTLASLARIGFSRDFHMFGHTLKQSLKGKDDRLARAALFAARELLAHHQIVRHFRSIRLDACLRRFRDNEDRRVAKEVFDTISTAD